MEAYINIGTNKACCSVRMSKRLLGELHRHPFLYYAVQEALESAENGYYSIGIIVWHDLLKDVLHAVSKQDSNERNVPAHDILATRPTKGSYDALLAKFKSEAKKVYLREIAKAKNNEEYISQIIEEWEELQQDLNK